MNRRVAIIGLSLLACLICAGGILWLEGWTTLGRVSGPLTAGAMVALLLGWVIGGRPDTPPEKWPDTDELPIYSSTNVSTLDVARNGSVGAVSKTLPTDSQEAIENQTAGDQRLVFYAQELHDEVADQVSAIKSMGVSISRRARDPAMVQASQVIVQSADRLEEAIAGVLTRRKANAGPATSLSDAVAHLVRQYQNDSNGGPSGRKFVLRISPQVDSADTDVAQATCQIVRCALDNAAIHSGADHIEVNLRVSDGHLIAQVADNGIGMPAKLSGQSGLAAMAERAKGVGGVFEVGKSRWGGVIARATLPFTEAAPAARVANG